VLRTFGPEVEGGWRRLHNEELHNKNIIGMIKSRKMRWAVHVARIGDVRNMHKILVGKHERKKRLGKPRCGWEGNIRMDLK
jgi:hypothetical protein